MAFVEEEGFGSDIPYSEPYWYKKGFSSPFYTESHVALRQKVRDFVDKHITPFATEWDEEGRVPPELLLKAYDEGIFAACWHKDLIGFEQTGNIPDFDPFHDLIWIDEIGRCGSSGLGAAFTIYTMALYPILLLGSEELRNRIVPDVISARKQMALCITEPYAGSDVRNIQTVAKKVGNSYIVNGQKKFITRGDYADYFTVAVRTGPAGFAGISLMVIPRDAKGVTVRKMPLCGNWSAGTAWVTFDDVQVDSSNLIGNENEGFRAILLNFNHERFIIAAQANRASRSVLEESIKYARERRTFDKRLIDHQVIRFKIMEMALRVEQTHSYLEQLAYQVKAGTSGLALAGNFALAKVMATRTAEFCSRESSQIFGGASYVRGGKGQFIERFVRESRAMAIYGGSEEIMLDLAAKQAKL